MFGKRKGSEKETGEERPASRRSLMVKTLDGNNKKLRIVKKVIMDKPLNVKLQAQWSYLTARFYKFVAKIGF